MTCPDLRVYPRSLSERAFALVVWGSMKITSAPLLIALSVALAAIGPAYAGGPKPDPKSAKDPALTALWSGAPLSLSEDELRKAGLADGSKEAPIDYLLNRLEVRYEPDGRAHTLRHMVLRYRTREAVEGLGTFDVPYSPWFEDRPVIKGRVVPARGPAVAIDPRTIAEAAAKNPELIVSDRKNLVVPLPHLAVGATVELVIESSNHKSPYGSVVRNGFHGREPSARATIVQIEAPAALAPRMKALGTEATITEKKHEGNVIARAEMIGPTSRVANHDGKPHGIMWGVGAAAGGWEGLAKHYGETLAPILAGPTGWPVAAGTRRERIGQIVTRVAKELRYTGLHLGDAAIVPFAPKETLTRGYGDCKDLATLVVRALAEAGVAANVALLRAGDKLAIDPELAGLDLFDHAIVYVPAEGREPAIWIDATAPEFGVGAIPGADLGRFALVIDATTKAPTATPVRASPENIDRFHVDIEYRPEPIGPGKVKLTYTFGGEQRYVARRLYGGQDPDALADIQRVAARNFAGQVASINVEGIDDALAPITLTIELVDVRRLDSDGRSHKLGLGMDAAMQRLDKGLLEIDRRFPYELPRGVDYAIRYRVFPPRGYRVSDLPKDADLELGPLHWKVSFVQRDDGVVEAHGRFEVPMLDFTPKQVGEIQDGWEGRGTADDFKIDLVPEQAKLAPLERAMWFHNELAARPKDSELRARWALELDKWGISDEARKEADVAAKDALGTAAARFVLTARARLWERDTFGRVYAKGWDRKRALAAWRAVLALDPKSTWARHELADILVRDVAGLRKTKRDKEHNEGLALLEATAREGSEPAVDRLLEAWDSVGANAEIIRFAESWKGTRQDAIDAKWAKAVALVEGPAAVAALIESWNEPRRISAGLMSVTSAYMMARRFADASAVFDSLSTLLGGAANPLAEWSDKVTKLPPLQDFSTPEKALQSFYSLLAENPADLDKRLETLFGKKLVADGAEQMKRLLRPGGVGSMLGDGPEARWAIYDMVFGLATLKSEGDDKTGWQVTLTMPKMGGGEAREFGKAYFVKSGATMRLVGFAGGSGVPFEGLERLAAGDIEGARKWLGWAWAGSQFKFKTLSEPDATTPIETLWRTGFLLAAAGGRLRVDNMVASLDVGGANLVGDERAIMLETLTRWTRDSAERDQVVALMDRMFAQAPASPNERAVRSRLLAIQGRKEEALALASERLATDPTDTTLISEMANIESVVGELDKARERLLALRDDGRLEDEGHNELAWLELCLGKIDDKTLESAKRGAKENNLAAVHTRAMIEIERGLLDAGAESARKLVGEGDEVAPHVWLVTGRMAEALGLNDLAVSYYKQVSGEGEIAGPTSSFAVARARIAKLAGK